MRTHNYGRKPGEFNSRIEDKKKKSDSQLTTLCKWLTEEEGSRKVRNERKLERFMIADVLKEREKKKNPEIYLIINDIIG